MKKFNFFDWLSRSTLYIALLAAWIAMAGSLYFSEVLHYVPCEMCWYQRILMYPLSIVIAVGLLRQDNNAPYMILPLSLLGQGFSTYHYLLQKTNLFSGAATCSTGVPCTTTWINWFGFVTIPFLAMIAFFIITIMALTALAVGEPRWDRDQPTPWFLVLGVVAIVLVAFAVLANYQGAANQGLKLSVLPVQAEAIMSTPNAALPSSMATVQGEQIYHDVCAACHGPDARGVAHLGNSLVDSDVIRNQDDTQVLAFIRAGVSLTDPRNQTGLVMPPSGGRPDLADSQIMDVVNYIRSLSH